MPRLVAVEKPTPPERPEQLAINLADLDRLDSASKKTLLSGRISLSGVVRVEPADESEVAVRFICDLRTAATICEVIRGYDCVAGDTPTRLYIRSDTEAKWRRVPGDVKLLRVLPDERIVLNPCVFPPIATGPVVPLPVKRVEL